MRTLREMDNRINVGEIFSRKQLMEMFKISGQSGIMKTNALKSFYESKQTGLPMYLFSKDKARNYIFEGKVELCGIPYQITEKDKQGNDRLVWKFPLKIIYSENVDLNEDDRLQQVANEVARIEEEIIKSKQGIINEEAIFKQERKRLLEEGANEQVEKVDEFFENKKRK